MSARSARWSLRDSAASGGWWCLQHVDFEGPAAIGDALAARGIDLRAVRLDLGEALPRPPRSTGWSSWVGRWARCEDDAHPHLPAERALIADCVGRGVPVLGVCLGAQLLAAALGADVYRGPRGEVGGGVVTLTDEGRADAVLGAGPDPLPVVHWHHDTFDLPARAVLLASSERYAHQAFRVGTNAYGLQFHVELGPAQLPVLQGHMNPARVPTEAELAAVAAAGRGVLERFVDLAC